jgi:hypothetical protein
MNIYEIDNGVGPRITDVAMYRIVTNEGRIRVDLFFQSRKPKISANIISRKGKFTRDLTRRGGKVRLSCYRH